MENLSKYDVMDKKSYKFSEILSSFIGKYMLSLTKKKKCETIKVFLDKILIDAHILFEIKNDIVNYLNVNSPDINVINFFENLNSTSKELEKVLLVYLLLNKKDESIIYQYFVDFISNKITESEMILCLCKNLNKQDQEILKLALSDDYDFNMLPSNYQRLMLENHSEYMDININMYVNKIENKQIEILKGIKLYKEKANMNISSEIKKYQSGKQKIKD